MKNKIFFSLRIVGTESPLDVEFYPVDTEIGAQNDYDLALSGEGYFEYRTQSLASALHCKLFRGEGNAASPSHAITDELEIIAYNNDLSPRTYEVIPVPSELYEAELAEPDTYKYESNFAYAMNKKSFFQAFNS